MRTLFYLLLLFLLTLVASPIWGQLNIKTEYIGKSSYKSKGSAPDNVKGDARIVSSELNVPIKLVKHDDKRMTVWAVGGAMKYTELNNRKLDNPRFPEEILNGQLTVFHIRPLSRRWSIMAAGGGGFYIADTRLSKITHDNIMFHAGFMAVYHLKPNLEVGLGPALSTVLGYPMIFPAIHFSWKHAGKYTIKTKFGTSMGLDVSSKVSNCFKISFVSEASGSMALEKEDGKKMMFNHKYYIAALRPELTFGQWSVPITLGVSAYRPLQYERRKLSSLFKSGGGSDNTHFTGAPYFSIGVSYGSL